MKILDTNPFFTKLVDYQLPVIFLPVIPKDVPFISIKYTVVLMFSALQLLRHNDTLDVSKCLPLCSKLHVNKVVVSLQLAPNWFGLHDVCLRHSKQFEPSTSACILNNSSILDNNTLCRNSHVFGWEWELYWIIRVDGDASAASRSALALMDTSPWWLVLRDERHQWTHQQQLMNQHPRTRQHISVDGCIGISINTWHNWCSRSSIVVGGHNNYIYTEFDLYRQIEDIDQSDRDKTQTDWEGRCRSKEHGRSWWDSQRAPSTLVGLNESVPLSYVEIQVSDGSQWMKEWRRGVAIIAKSKDQRKYINTNCTRVYLPLPAYVFSDGNTREGDDAPRPRQPHFTRRSSPSTIRPHKQHHSVRIYVTGRRLWHRWCALCPHASLSPVSTSFFILLLSSSSSLHHTAFLYIGLRGWVPLKRYIKLKGK